MTKGKREFTVPVMVFGELGLIYCVADQSIPVYLGADEKRSNWYSKYLEKRFLFPPYDSDEFIDELVRVGQTFSQRPVIMSYDERVLLNISKHRDRLQAYYNFMLPDHNMVDRLLDKQLFDKLAEEFELPTPASVEVSNKQEIKRVVSKLRAPYIIKPAYRHYWFHPEFSRVVGKQQKKGYVCKSIEELREIYGKISQIHPDVVVQEFIRGDDHQMYDVNMYVDKNKNVRGYVSSRKLRVYPPISGSGTCAETVEDSEIEKLARNITDKLNLIGMINLQMKRDEVTGRPMLIEIHTRTSTYDILGTHAGANIPALYYKDINGIKIPDYLKAKASINYIDVGPDLRLFLRYRKEISVSLWDWLKSYSKASVFHDFKIMDPKPHFKKFWEPVKMKFSKKHLTG